MLTSPANEMNAWASFVARHQHIPLDTVLGWTRFDLEYEAAQTLATLARNHAQMLLAENKPAPKGQDIYSQAVRRMVSGAITQQQKPTREQLQALVDRLNRERQEQQEAAKANAE